MSNENAAATTEAAEATTKFKRYNYRGTVHILSQGTKDGKAWCKFSVKGEDGKKKVEAYAYAEKATLALKMAQEAGKDKVLNIFGYFNPNNTSSFTNRKGETVTVRKLQVLDVNWPLPPKAKATTASTGEKTATEAAAQQPVVETAAMASAAIEENPFE